MVSSVSSESHKGSLASTYTSCSDHSFEEAHDNPEKPTDDSSKLRMFLGILRKFVGVADIATVRFSLPAQLLEPTPNLEYWNYLDQPSAFAAIGESNDSLERMLEVLRFWFTKDLKYVKGKPCKPYNSTLGEFFRCNWETENNIPTIAELRKFAEGSRSSSRSKLSRNSSISTVSRPKSTSPGLEKIKVSFLTEQTSHHPPVSAFFVECPEKGLQARGFDQITAKFTGMSVKVSPGEHNFGFYITLKNRDDEEYHLTHPAAHIGGLIRGSLDVSVCEQCYITCKKTRIKTILHYMEESWLGKPQNKVEGVIFKYDPENDIYMKIKDVPESNILARISGAWKESIYFSLGSSSKSRIKLIDLTPLYPAQKIVPPMSHQLPNESRRQWHSVTEAIKARQFGKATTLKLELEEKQRLKVKEREKNDKKWTPRFFVGALAPEGRPELTTEGKELLVNLQKDDWGLEEKVD
ncbi:Oxysterol-binding protein-like protein 1 [Erysiphe neolycopersici]|uniref:Oxysterol-binding protein-like protein 1 n=1 Tax=Erysiphe neolycopersici TaxID=212602 RepID=A0A420I5P7_9PEZI|nr:Oxysterol-binding protein-like protein 1 [Erysiphe neolycopersici]